MGNPKAEITLEWADGEYLFALKGAQIEELEAVCGKVGFGAIYQRVMNGSWFWSDLYHVIRLGLIGGGLGAVEAKRLTETYIQQPLGSGPNCPFSVASSVLGAVMFGFEDIPPKKPKAGENPAKEESSETSGPGYSSTE
ncbi:GTA-gp10 family protein [Nitratireductor sp. GCM10026969]|uniref:GTA-gp10 family protein n=1 Tax=Nitratireductor sp. GCM10026969 TaxID=3252645 RepID=UPI0036074A14